MIEPYYQDSMVTLFCGDSREIAPQLSGITACVTDPPYGLEFMGVAWDTFKDRSKGKERTRNEWSDFGSREHARHPSQRARIQRNKGLAFYEFSLEWADAVRQACLPGAPLLAFGGTRTFHRQACAIEDAGWELRDTLMYLYGSGFPKSLDVGKAIDKQDEGKYRRAYVEAVQEAGLTLPANSKWDWTVGDHSPGNKWWKVFCEWLPSLSEVDQGRLQRIVIGKGFKPRPTFHTANIGSTATANEYDITAPATDAAKLWDGWGTALKPAYEPITLAMNPLDGTFAANAVKHGVSGLNVDGCRIETDENLNGGAYSQNKQDDGEWGTMHRAVPDARFTQPDGRFPANVIHDGSDEVVRLFPETANGYRANQSRSTGAIFGNSDTQRGERGHDDSGSAARFFKSLSFQEVELLFHQAKAIMAVWNYDLANTADDLSSLSNQHAFSVLSDAAILASHGRLGLSEPRGLSTNVTQKELRRLCETVTTAILSLEKKHSPEPQQERRIPNGCLVKFAETSKLTGIITITISRWKSDGSADAATFSITLPNSAHGEAASVPRAFYTAKASSSERGKGNNHPTVKPLDLMKYLVKLVSMPERNLILDPFAGSGTTLYAAKELGVKCIGVEMSEAYCEIIAERLRQGVIWSVTEKETNE